MESHWLIFVLMMRPFYCEWLVIITFKPDVIEDHAGKLDGEANKVYIS